MDFSTYQKMSRKTAGYPTFGARWVYPALGLVNEAGEVAGKIKKLIRDNNGILTEEIKDGIKKELGDVLWYLTQLSTDFEINLDDVATSNLQKLKSRADRGMLCGNGDER